MPFIFFSNMEMYVTLVLNTPTLVFKRLGVCPKFKGY